MINIRKLPFDHFELDLIGGFLLEELLLEITELGLDLEAGVLLPFLLDLLDLLLELSPLLQQLHLHRAVLLLQRVNPQL